MLTKVFPTGQGKGYGPVQYLCAINPFGRGKRQNAPQVLSGDPAMIMRQIDAIPYKHKYTSGVHSFAPEDKPTDDQIMEVIEATEELAFAGLPLSSRSILWIKHEHAGRTELHFLIPRQEINSGKSFNAFPPGWQQKYDLLRDKFNYKYGWARPDDPERARQWQPGINAKISQDAKRKGKENPKAEIFSLTDDLANMAIQGKLSTRKDIVEELRKRGYVINRQGKDYLTIVDKEGKKTRLKGTLFEENFNGPEWVKSEIAKIKKPDSEKTLVDLKLAEEADAKLQEALRKSAQYNINRYSLEENEDEQPAGKQTVAKSEIDQGNLGNGNEGYSGKPAAFPKSANSERDEIHALYAESGLGEGATRHIASAQRENAEATLRENPLSDSSSSALGRAMGAESEMADGNRRATERLYDRSNKDSQNSFRAGTGNYRRESGKPGRHDEADHGQPERSARQGIQSGELIQIFRSLKKDAEKLETTLSRLNQADKKLHNFELDFRPVLENMDNIAGQTINGLKLANETRLLQNLLSQSSGIAPIKIGNLLIQGDEAVKWLRALNEQKLLQKLAKSGMPLALPDLEAISSLANAAQHNLVMTHDIRFVAYLTKAPSSLSVLDLECLTQEAKRVSHTLRKTSEFRQLEQFNWIPASLESPALQKLASKGKIACNSLKKVNDFIILSQLNRYKPSLVQLDTARFGAQARFIVKKLKTTYETKMLINIYQAEMQRRKIINNCYSHAEWAGSDLQRWDRVFAEYEKYPKRMKILNGLIDAAHSRFLEILAETRKMNKIQNRCGNNPFLLYEFGKLQEKIDQYNAQQAQMVKRQESVKNEDESWESESEGRNAPTRGSSLKM